MQKGHGNASSSILGLNLLGGFTLIRPGMECHGLSYEKGRALLAYIALAPGIPHARRSLASLLWPDHSLKTALANLRLVLLNLRQVLNNQEHDCLRVERDSVLLDIAQLGDLDLARFTRARPACTAPDVAHQSSECTGCLHAMAAGIEAYQGKFMAGFSLPDCPDFEEWLQQQRETLHRHALELATRLADCHERRGDYAAGLSFALHYLELCPWDEEAYRRAMRLLALNGQTGAALAQFEHCRHMLKDELGFEPAAATVELAKRIRDGSLRREAGRVGASSSAAPSNPALVLPPPAERRQLTVLYGELSASNIEDPDEASALLYPAQCRWVQTIMRYSGHVVQTYTGGLLAYFGYPVAHENAAREALLAALAIVRDTQPGVRVRLGVHTGLVVSGGSDAVPDMVGTTTSLAIRLRLLIEDGNVAVSSDTARLVEGYFNFAPLGERRFPGISRSLDVFRMLGESEATDRLGAAGHLTPLVGRTMELNALMNVWNDVRAGHRHLVLLRGEAGIGKSRLLLAFKERLADQECVIREVRCTPEFSQSPFQPFIASIESLLGFSAEDSDTAKFARLAAYLESAHEHMAADAVPLLATFLSLPTCPPYADLTPPSPQAREAIFDLLPRLLHNLAQRKPVLFLFEDLHWADPSTRDALMYLVSHAQDMPILVVMTARPEYASPWVKDRVESWLLGGLEDDEVASMITAQAPDLCPAILQRLVERADGIPLFAEELAKIDSSGDDNEIPATLTDLLAARIDASGSAKMTAQLAATIGRNFDPVLLQDISSQTPEAQLHALHELEAAGLIKRGDGTNYQFCHALVHDAAYLSQTRTIRQASHLRIAKALLAGNEHFVRKNPAIIAHHLAAGDDFAQAIAYWLKGGNLALRHAANHEAAHHFRAGLQLIDRLPHGPKSEHLELDLQNGLALAAIALGGYASPEASSALAKIVAQSEQHPDTPDMFRALWGLWASASSRSGYRLAADLARQLLHIAEQNGKAAHVAQAHFALGNTHFWQGNFILARAHLEAALASYHPRQRAIHLAHFGEDLRITAGSYLSWVLAFLDSPEAAEDVSAKTLANARQIKHPFSLCYALTFAALLQCRLQRPEAALSLANETIALAEAHAFHLWGIGGHIARGWARAAQGELGGVAEISQCIEATQTAMSGVTLLVLHLLADAQVRTQQYDDALETIRLALNTGRSLDDHHVEAELLCLRGQALLGQWLGNTPAATKSFERALTISSQQQATSIVRQVQLAQVAMMEKANHGCYPTRPGKH